MPRPTRKGPTAELGRLWLYRLGLSGVHAKYRVVPRSAIVDYEGLEQAVRSWSGGESARDTVALLWQRHGAPSPEVADRFLAAAADLDRAAAPTETKRRVLEGWLRVCRPPSRFIAVVERLELGAAFVCRRLRQRSLKRPLETGTGTLSALRRAGVR